MGVIDLDRHVLMKLAKVVPLVLTFLEDKLRTVGHHKILLVDAEQVAGPIAVIRV